LKDQFPILCIYRDSIPLLYASIEYLHGKRILDQVLNRSLEGSGPVNRIEACLGQEFLGAICQFQDDLSLFEAFADKIGSELKMIVSSTRFRNSGLKVLLNASMTFFSISALSFPDDSCIH